MPKPTRSSPRKPGPAGPPSAPRPPPLDDAPRDMVCRRLASQARRFPEFDLTEPEPPPAGMDARDAAFAHAVYTAAVARWLTLSYLLGRAMDRPLAELEPKMQGVLLAGSAQLLFLDRVPPHAAINHAVEWAKQRIRPKAGGLANAVLRKIARLRPEDGLVRRERYADGPDELPLADGSALALTEPVLPDDHADRLSVATSHPRALLDAWVHSRSPREVRRLALHSLADAPTILNTAHAAAPLPTGAPLAPHSTPGHHVFTGSRPELINLLAARRDLWVQDPASSLAVASIADLRPGLVLDFCAGLGTKTRQLDAVFPDASIIATDTDPGRFAMLSTLFAGHARVRVLPPARVREECLERADLILIDAPCSNTGVLARRPEARYRFGPASLASVAGVQRQIIADSIPLLAAPPTAPRRGRILYSTCSLEPDENERQAAWAAKWHAFRPTRESRHAPTGGPGDEPLPPPPQRYTDGSYSILLE